MHLPCTYQTQHSHNIFNKLKAHPFIQGLPIGCVAHVAGDELVLLDLQCPRQSGCSRTRYYYVHPDQHCQELKVYKLLKSDTILGQENANGSSMGFVKQKTEEDKRHNMIQNNQWDRTSSIRVSFVEFISQNCLMSLNIVLRSILVFSFFRKFRSLGVFCVP